MDNSTTQNLTDPKQVFQWKGDLEWAIAGAFLGLVVGIILTYLITGSSVSCIDAKNILRYGGLGALGGALGFFVIKVLKDKYMP